VNLGGLVMKVSEISRRGYQALIQELGYAGFELLCRRKEKK